MTKLLTALGTASLLALTACGGGGGSETETNNVGATTEDLTLPVDENAALGDTLGDQADVLDTGNAADANLAGNTADAGNTVANSTGNVTNSQ